VHGEGGRRSPSPLPFLVFPSPLTTKPPPPTPPLNPNTPTHPHNTFRLSPLFFFFYSLTRYGCNCRIAQPTAFLLFARRYAEVTSSSLFFPPSFFFPSFPSPPSPCSAGWEAKPPIFFSLYLTQRPPREKMFCFRSSG